MSEPVRIIVADVLAGLAQLADRSVHCCVTSPPYWGLRDYGVEGQIGLEPTPEAFVARMVEVFAAVRRVLRDDGTLWLNLGDSYCSTDKWGGGTNGNTGKHTVGDDGSVPSWAVRSRKAPIPGIKPKDLCMMPWRVALALQADGWYLRSVIVWHKRSPMPESVTDRPTSSWEPIFLLAKSERYFYDAEAIREEPKPWNNGQLRAPKLGAERIHGAGEAGTTEKQYDEIKGANRRNVWPLSAEPYAEAHFATFPSEIPRRAIKAGCPKDGVVLDPFLGSGTTIAVARELGRRGIGIELNPAYAELARIRIGKTEKPSTFQDPRIKDSPLFTEAH